MVRLKRDLKREKDNHEKYIDKLGEFILWWFLEHPEKYTVKLNGITQATQTDRWHGIEYGVQCDRLPRKHHIASQTSSQFSDPVGVQADFAEIKATMRGARWKDCDSLN